MPGPDRARSDRRAPAQARFAAVGLALLLAVTVAACGDGVQERGDPRVPSTTAPGGDAVLVPPDTAPADVPPGDDPSQLLGADPELDDLAQACFAGDLFACDTLFLRTEVGSSLEAYSQTCGGRVERQDGAPGCAERFGVTPPAAAPPGELGDDAELDALAASCFGGDTGACDDLYLGSPVDSAYEAYGATCGGRLALAADGGCESQLGQG